MRSSRAWRWRGGDGDDGEGGKAVGGLDAVGGDGVVQERPSLRGLRILKPCNSSSNLSVTVGPTVAC